MYHQSSPPPLQCLGLTHHSAPIDVLALAQFCDTERDATLANARREAGLERLVILSTCNRVELYASLSPDNVERARDRLAAYLSRNDPERMRALEPHLHFRHGTEALEHLCRVAVGVDSLVVGETEILTQVRGAIRAASSAHAASPALKRMFSTALRAGERARAEAWKPAGATSISAVAAELAHNAASLRQDPHIVVVGAGTMGRLAVKALQARGATRVTVANRTVERANKMALRYGIAACGLDVLPNVLRDAHAAIVATGSDTTIITRSMIDSPITVIDIGVPRNVDPTVGDISGVEFFDLDTIQTHIAQTLSARQDLVNQVEMIVAEEMGLFLAKPDVGRGAVVTP